MRKPLSIARWFAVCVSVVVVGCTPAAAVTPTGETNILPITQTSAPTAQTQVTAVPSNTAEPNLPATVSPPTEANLQASQAVFPIGPGGADVIPHQVVRTQNDLLYIFSSQQSSTTLRVYHTSEPGFPDAGSDFAAPIELTESSEPISVDAVYDGSTIIHVLINTLSGEIRDHPFDTSSNSFKESITLASDGATYAGSGLYVGTSGLSGMMDKTSILHVAYWANGDHILHRAYTYDSAANSLSPASDFMQVDEAGYANHPVIAISPLDNSLTVAWISENNDPAQILTRTRSTDIAWGDIEIASRDPVWTNPDNGLNIDQGPSLIVDSAGVRHMVYIQLIDYSVGDYGRIHYVTNTGSGWVDQPLNAFSHDPALAINDQEEIYIIGHGHPLNATCQSMDEMCISRKDGDSWGNPSLFASPPDGYSFDSSPSVKWSVVGFNRPNAIEFIFFMTPYDAPTVYYGRMP